MPSNAYAWYTVFLLTVVYIFSFIDRFILGLLVEPIKADMQLSDTQIGWLLGPAFAIFYTTMGIPLGWLADRGRRTWIVAAGTTVWSLATMASGLAINFTQLFVARIMIGVGEATVSPCALSIIADSFPVEKRAKPVAFYSAAVSIGAGIAALAGASVIVWSKSVDEISLPLIGSLAPWQLAFIVVGLPGLLVAVIMALTREPVRQEIAGVAGGNSIRDAFAYVRKHWRAYSFVAIPSLMTIVAYSQFWLPAVFERSWGWPPEKYGFYSGIAFIALCPATVIICGWLTDKLRERGKRDAPLKISITGGILLTLAGGFGPFMPSAELAFATLSLCFIGLALVTAVAPTALLNITPGEIRGQVVAIYFLVTSAAGMALGPMTVGLLNDLVMGESGARFSLGITAFMYGIPVMMYMPIALRFYRKRLVELG
jgi:MFS family permease